MSYTKMAQISKGWSSYIYLAKDKKGNKIAIKEVREKSPRKDLAQREGRMLLLANSVKVGPKVVEVNYEENFVAYEFIEGERLLDWIMGEEFENVSSEQYWDFLKKLYKQMLALDALHLSHNQLEVGKNILVKKINSANEVSYEPVVIDFEKATIKENKTRNIGQIESMLFYNPHSEIAKKSREKLNATL